MIIAFNYIYDLIKLNIKKIIMTKTIKQLWRDFSFGDQIIAVLFYKKDVAETERLLINQIKKMKDDLSEDEKFSEADINNFEKKAEKNEQRAFDRKLSEIRLWKTIVPSILGVIVLAIWKQIDAADNETVIHAAYIMKLLLILGIIMVTFHSIRSVALRGRQLSFAQSCIVQAEKLRGHKIHYDELEELCLFQSSNLTRVFSSVTRQEIKKMFVVFWLAIFFFIFFVVYQFEYIIQIWNTYL